MSKETGTPKPTKSTDPTLLATVAKAAAGGGTKVDPHSPNTRRKGLKT
jgi:hypothetical protein